MRQSLNRNTKYFFTIPTVTFVVICMAYPLLYSLYMSLHEWRMSAVTEPVWVGFTNFISLLSDSRVRKAIWFTFSYFFVTVSCEALFGIAIAMMLHKVKRHQSLIRTGFIFPMVATPLAMGYVWRMMYDPTTGLFNAALRYFGLPTSPWLTSTKTVFSSLAIMEIWHGTPLIILVVLAGLSGLNADYYESAKIDGANSVQIFFRITLPLLMPTITMGVMLRGIDVLKLYDLIYATTGGGPKRASENLNLLVYTYAFDYLDMGKACALMLIFFIIVLTFALICIFFKRRLERRFS